MTQQNVLPMQQNRPYNKRFDLQSFKRGQGEIKMELNDVI